MAPAGKAQEYDMAADKHSHTNHTRGLLQKPQQQHKALAQQHLLHSNKAETGKPSATATNPQPQRRTFQKNQKFH